MLAKTVIWIFILAGLLPAAWLAFISHSMHAGVHRQRDQLPQPDAIFVHDTYIEIAGQRWQLPIYPRSWTSSIIVAGILAVVIGLFFLLHVPQSHTS